ncbi:glycosyltransferase family 4 protein [Candidatus Pelagibacter sp.]|nr:glycosyltransferase family 4 protein [Candidatus Pelagibacter sp.]
MLINNLSFFFSHRLPIAESTLAKGFDVVVGYGELGGVDPKHFEKKGLRFISVPMQRGGINPLNDLKTFYYIWNFFKSEKPDIVHLVTIKPYLYGGIISRIVNVPCLVSAVSGLGSLFISNDLKSRFLRLLLYPFYKLAFNHKNQKIIVQNQDDLDTLKKWGVLNALNVKLLKGSGVELANFKNFEEQNGIPVICFAARLLKDKGVNEFVSAAKILKQRKINARFLLAGDLDSNNPTSLNLDNINQIKSEGCVEILGYYKDIAELYNRSHIICLPSYREGLPKALLEAGAASRAVVTTDVPGCRDAIIPNKTGLLVPVKNFEKLADTLQWLIEHPEERVAMGRAGRKFVEKEFSVEKIIQGHINIYDNLLSKIVLNKKS